jgi:hypothetical protein
MKNIQVAPLPLTPLNPFFINHSLTHEWQTQRIKSPVNICCYNFVCHGNPISKLHVNFNFTACCSVSRVAQSV